MKPLLILLGCLSATAADVITNGTKQLLLVQAVWRHGDRSPTETYVSDPYQEDSWTFGGSGWGQLSPTGMQQHLKLGKLLRKRYIDETYQNFLSKYYNSHEIYVRSTDVNRTIISAISNMIGMYGQPSYNNRLGTDLPNATNAGADDPVWPAGFIPIAVHTVDDDTDYIGNADATCRRQKQLWELAKTSDELQTYINSPAVTWLLKNLTYYCNETVDIDNLWIIADSFLIEQIWFNNTFYSKVPWWTPYIGDQTVIINDQVELYQNGVFNNTLMMNGLDIGLELKKIRGGSLTNDILMHAHIKLDCWRNNDTSSKCKWINKLKYYVYSAHDTTVYAFFSCLGIQSKAVKPHGYPKYSAATLFELWYDTAEGASYFRLMYHDQDGDGVYSITEEIPECLNQTYCPLSVYEKYAQQVKPDMPMDQWCLVDPNPKSPAALISSFTGMLFTLFVAYFNC